MPVMESSLGPLAYDDTGSGPPVVLLHATLHDRGDYADVVDALSERYRVLAVDWPGHGESGPPRAPVTAVALANALAEFVRELELPAAVIVGSSVGGFAACRLAIDDPSRVAGLVLVNSGGFTPWSPASRAFCAVMGMPAVVRRVFRFTVPMYMQARSATDRRIVGAVVARSGTDEGARIAASLWRSFPERDADLRDRADRISAPTLFTWGARDRTLRVSWGRAAHRMVAGSRFVEMSTGHVPFSSQPQEWLDVVVPFLERIWSAEHSPS